MLAIKSIKNNIQVLLTTTQQKNLHLVYMVSVTEKCPILENVKHSHY